MIKFSNLRSTDLSDGSYWLTIKAEVTITFADIEDCMSRYDCDNRPDGVRACFEDYFWQLLHGVSHSGAEGCYDTCGGEEAITAKVKKTITLTKDEIDSYMSGTRLDVHSMFNDPDYDLVALAESLRDDAKYKDLV